MKINGVMQAPQANNNVSEAQNFQPIDEKQIKSILFLGIKNDIKMASESAHSVDTYA
jgi:hypothetical protein